MPLPDPLSKPLSLRADAEAVIAQLTAAGYVAVLAGGCVRDELLGLTPKDFDVATDAPPATIRRLFKHTQAVGAAFGVMLVRIGQSTIEVARFRTDGTYLDGRHPTSVQVATAKEDAQRRDFTINGLFYDVGLRRVIDYVGGEADLRAKILRAIGDPQRRFMEDHLRLLRAVRFAARFDLTINLDTATAIKRHAPQLASISPERIAEELRLMLLPATRSTAWQLLDGFGLLKVIFRFAPPLSVTSWPAVPLEGDVGLLPAVLAAQVYIRHGIGEWTAPLRAAYQRGLRTALRWSNLEADVFETLLGRIVTATQQPLSLALKRRWTDDSTALAKPFYGEVDLKKATMRRVLMSVVQQQTFEALAAMHPEFHGLKALSDELEILGRVANPPPLLGGDDLIAAGFRPGPAFKQSLHEAYDAQLEDRVGTREAALAYVRAKLTGPSSG